MHHRTKIAFVIAASLHAALGCVITVPPSTRLAEAPAAHLEVALCDAPPASDQETPPETVAGAPVEEVKPRETIPESAPEPIEITPKEPVPVPTTIVPESKPRIRVAKSEAPSTRPTAPAKPAKGSATTTDSGIYHAAGNVSFLRRPVPVYPADALRARQTGRVVLRLYINEFGRVDRVETQTSSGISSLDVAATAAAKKSTFRPAVREGSPVKSKASVPFSFQIKS